MTQTSPPLDGVALTIDGTWNSRDAATLTGLAPGVMLRSAALAGLTDAGRSTLDELGVVDVVDLRAPFEVASSGKDAVGPQIAVHALPIAPGAQLAGQIGEQQDPSQIQGFIELLKEPGFAEEFMANLYREMVTDPTYVSALGSGLRVLAESDGAVLVHCSAGKDRTGVLVALAATLAGADRDAIEADFMYSNHAQGQQTRVIPPIPGIDPSLLAPFMGVSLASLHAALQAIESGGGRDAFLAAAGVTPEHVGRLRERLTASA